MRYGFIGTGGITTAIVTGLCTADNPPETIWVSPAIGRMLPVWRLNMRT